MKSFFIKLQWDDGNDGTDVNNGCINNVTLCTIW